jgi:hypothetical protein
MTRGTCDGPHPPPVAGHPHPESQRCYCARCERAGQRWAWSLAESTQEVGRSGRCRAGHPVSALADVVAGRIYTAGITPDDPGLVLIRAWNEAATVRCAVSGITAGAKPDTPGRRANGEPAGLLREHGGDVCLPLGDHQAQQNSAPVRERTESASTPESQDLVANGRETSLQGPHTNRSLTAPAFSNRSRR